MIEYQESQEIEQLLNQYRESLKETRLLLRKISRKIEPLDEIIKDRHSLKLEKLAAKENMESLLIDRSIVKSWEQNLLYCIEWMETGRRPGNRRGAERLSAYQREKPFENYWIQRRIDKRSLEEIDSVIIDDELNPSKKEKEAIVKEMTANLSEKQKTMLTLSSNGYSHSEIAKLLKVKKGTVDVTIARAKSKIEDEGWFMI